MSFLPEVYLKWRKSQTGYERPLPPPPGVSAPQPPQTVPSVARSSQPTARPTAVAVPPREAPRRDARVGLTPNGLIVRQPSAGDDNRPPMGDLTIDLNIQAPVTNHARW